MNYFRVEKSEEYNSWLVVQNSNDMIVVGFNEVVRKLNYSTGI
jgi:hypothetical protein